MWKASLLVCSRCKIFLGGGGEGWWLRKIFQEMFLILRLNSKWHSNKDYFENLFLNPYSQKWKNIFWYKHNKQTNMPHTCNLAKCNPSSDRCPRERLSNATEIVIAPRFSDTQGRIFPPFQNVCVKHRGLNFYYQSLHIVTLWGFPPNIPTSTVKVTASASGWKVNIWRCAYQWGWKHLGVWGQQRFHLF